MKKQKGFSLVELLIAASVVWIGVAMTVPALQQARKTANESAAMSNLRSLAAAEYIYAARHNHMFGTLPMLHADGYVDSRFSRGGVIVGGYRYSEQYAVMGLPPGVQTSPPYGFGFAAIHQAESDYDFEMGTDGLVRYGPSAPSGSWEGRPIGK